MGKVHFHYILSKAIKAKIPGVGERLSDWHCKFPSCFSYNKKDVRLVFSLGIGGIVMNQRGIADLDILVESLPPQERNLFGRLFHLSTTLGALLPPETMYPWINDHFGSVEMVATQKIVKLTNLITFEGALFNRLRASRPIEAKSKLTLEAQLIDVAKNDPLRHPLTDTPEDSFGRIVGEYCLTAANIAKYDGLHAIVVFNDHNPLHFSKEKIIDYFDVAMRWAQAAHSYDPAAKYFFLIWNCLWGAGASLEHGHAQVMLSHDISYAKIERLRRDALGYRQQYGSNYFDDLYQVHASLGCALEKQGVKIISYLSPIKEKEIMLLGKTLDASFEEMIYQVLDCYRNKIGVGCFNLILSTPPLGEVEESWEGFPILVRLVDRGDPQSRASDMGAMELYASSIISSDPFEVARLLKECLLT